MALDGFEYDNTVNVFARAAKELLDRGIPLVPIPPKTKACKLKDWPTHATTDKAIIAEWQKQNPNQNVGAVAKANGFCILDIDNPDLIKFPTGCVIPPTFSVKSRLGTHHYFKQTDATRACGNLKLSKSAGFDFQQDNAYVVGPHSVHPKGPIYTVIDHSEIVDCPDWLALWIEQHRPAPVLHKSGLVIGGTKITPEQFEKWLELHYINHNEGYYFPDEKRWRWILADQCPWEDEHTNPNGPKDACVMLHDQSGPQFRCMHSHPKHWSDFRAWAVNRSGGKDYGMVSGTEIKPGNDPDDIKTNAEIEWKTGAEFKPVALEWLWKGRIPRNATVAFAGDPSVAKTTISLDIMARGSKGKPFLDGGANELGVFDSIILSAEDDPNMVLVPRLVAMDADLARIHFPTCVKVKDGESMTEREIRLDTDIHLLQRKIEANPNIKLVVIDPISNYAGDKNIMNEQEIRQIMMPLNRLAQEYHVSIVCIFHNSKQQGRTALHKVIGAVGNVGACRMGWSFLKDPEDNDQKLMLQMKENFGKFGGIKYTTVGKDVLLPKSDGTEEYSSQACIQYNGPTDVSANDLLMDSEDQGLKKEHKNSKDLQHILGMIVPFGTEKSLENIKKELANWNHPYTNDMKMPLKRAREKLGIIAKQHPGSEDQAMWARPALGEPHEN